MAVRGRQQQTIVCPYRLYSHTVQPSPFIEAIMDLRLQQALLATRSGEPEAAQILLSDLIREKPGETNAWFLLSYLVDRPERQARYLQQVLALDPEHALAQEHLLRLLQPGVPAPVIQVKQKQERPSNKAAVVAEPPPTPAPASLPTPVAQNEGLPDWLRDLDDKRLGVTTTPRNADQEWLRSAGSPMRDPMPAEVRAATAVSNNSTAQVDAPATPGTVDANQKMLLGILLALVLLSMVVLAFLLLQIFL